MFRPAPSLRNVLVAVAWFGAGGAHAQDSAHAANAVVLVWEPDSPAACEPISPFGQDPGGPTLAAVRLAAAGVPARVGAFVGAYQSCWCAYRLGHAGDALPTLRSLLDGTPPGPARDALLADLVRFHADLDTDGQALARDLTALVPPEPVTPWLERLAAEWTRRGNLERARQTWTSLLAADPLSPRAPDWEMAHYGLLRSEGRSNEQLPALEGLLAHYGPGSAWAGAHPEQAPALVPAFEALFRQRLKEALQEIPKSEDRLSRPRALATYEALFRLFPNAAADLQLRYEFAGFLLYLHLHDRAWEAYVWVRDADAGGAYALDAANGALAVAQSMRRREPDSALWQQREREANEAADRLGRQAP